MKQFIFTGQITLNGVVFYIEAKTLEEAETKAAYGEYKQYDTGGAETVDWEINPRTGEENK